MRDNHGFRWQNNMYCWYVPRKRTTPGKDLMMIGYHPEFGRVQYWRHETKNPGAGNTFFLYYNNKGKRVKYNVKKWLCDMTNT